MAVPKVVGHLLETGEMIKFQHTVFALPFALIALITASPTAWPPLSVWLWVLVAMVAARTAAMSFNRLADQAIDARNPRTAERSLPAGRLSRRFVWTVTAVSIGLFVWAAANLNPLCLKLAAPTLVVLLGYSLSKRFTAFSHLWLGVALGIAPIGAWAAVTGRLELPPIVLGAGVVLWVAGFDIIYSLQDERFDRDHGLHSMPSRIGAAPALAFSRLMHGGALIAYAIFARMAGGGPWRWSAVVVAGLMLIWQHRLVSPHDLRRVDAAFFTTNGLLSLIMGLLFIAARITAPV